METLHQLQAIKYTTVLENGIIKIPQFEKYVNQEVDIFVVLKTSTIKETKKQSVDVFLDKWTGFFSETNSDDIKYK